MVRYKDRDLTLVLTDSLGDLQRRKYEAARRVQDEVERHVGIGHLYSAKNLFGIVDVDVTCNRKTEQSHGFLTMHHQDHRDFRVRSSCEILRTRMASSIFCCSNGWIAEKMKNNQNRSPIDMGLSFWHRRYQSRARLRPGSRLGSAEEGDHRLQNLKQEPQADKDERVDFEEQRDEQD